MAWWWDWFHCTKEARQDSDGAVAVSTQRKGSGEKYQSKSRKVPQEGDNDHHI